MGLALRYSRGGLIAAAIYLMAIAAVFCWIFFVASKNPADSGESGILLLPFAMPWLNLLPSDWLGLPAAAACFLLNALIIYLVFGGLRGRRGQR